MSGGPAETGIGVAAVGIGILIVTAAYYGVPVLGKDGMLTSVFTEGKFPAKPQKKSLFTDPNFSFAPGEPQPQGGGGGGGVQRMTPTQAA